MIAPTQLKKPSNWQDFESLCKLLWGEIWDCSDSIKKHGRQGQNQHGVDIYAYVEKYQGYCGIQCKGKDEYTNAQLTEDEIDNEIEKAKTFRPKLKILIFATTANKDAKIETYIREKDVECRSLDLFRLDIFSWEDIVDQLERYRETYNWYVNNCQFKEATDVSVTFNDDDITTIHPEFVKKTLHYEFKQLSELEKVMLVNRDSFERMCQPLPVPWNRPSKHDCRWCDLDIRIENTGSTVIKTPKLIVSFRPEDIEKLDDGFHYCNNMLIGETVRVQINANREAKREVFKTYSNVLEYRPKDNILVQKDIREFTISIIPTNDLTAIPLFWEFLCEDFQKEGSLTINIVPGIEEVVEKKLVYNKEELKPDKVTIEPKIVER